MSISTIFSEPVARAFSTGFPALSVMCTEKVAGRTMRGSSGVTVSSSFKPLVDSFDTAAAGACLLQPVPMTVHRTLISATACSWYFARRPRGRASALMRMFVAGAGGNHAAVRHFADGVLELDGSVVDVEARCQLVANLAQEVFTLGSAHIGDADVT